MSARLILHIITTLVLFSIGIWLYMQMVENANETIGSASVAKYWFASLVYIFFSWVFYWIVHRLKLSAWIIAQILAIIIAAVATLTLLYIANEHQQQLEQKAMQQERDAQSSIPEEQVIDGSESISDDKPQTLNLSEGDIGESESSESGESDNAVE